MTYLCLESDVASSAVGLACLVGGVHGIGRVDWGGVFSSGSGMPEASGQLHGKPSGWVKVRGFMPWRFWFLLRVTSVR